MGTIRYHPPSGKLGRLAVRKLYRGTGAGRILVDALEEHVKLRRGRGGEYAKEHGQKEVLVEASAQHQAQGFYERVSPNLAPVRCDLHADPFLADSWATLERGRGTSRIITLTSECSRRSSWMMSCSRNDIDC